MSWTISSMTRNNRLKLGWMPQALEGVRKIQNQEKRQQLRASARLLAAHPEMHRLRRTQSWGLVGILGVSPFVAVYRVVGQELQILDVLREEYLASREITED